MKISDIILYEAPVALISKQEAIDRGMFGPVYHGTTAANRDEIKQQGFKIAYSDDVPQRHGFYGDLNKPLHLLGIGVYFTPSKTVAKQYNNDTMKGVIEYYLDVPRLCEIGFTSQNTIARWWHENGFDPKPVGKPGAAHAIINGNLLAAEQLRATRHMTDVLKSKYDAAYLKRNAYRRGVDDTQIVVFDPKRIYQIDKKASTGWQIGSQVVHNQNIIYNTDFMKNKNIKIEKQSNGWTFITAPDYYLSDQLHPTNRHVIHKIPPPGMKGTIVESPFNNQDRYQYMKFSPGEGRESMEQNRIRSTINPRYHNQAQSYFAVKWNKGGVMYNYIQAELDPINPGKD